MNSCQVFGHSFSERTQCCHYCGESIEQTRKKVFTEEMRKQNEARIKRMHPIDIRD